MKNWKPLAWIGASVLALLATIGAATRGTARPQDEPKPCCYTHPDHAGVCEVTPGEGETCESILDYLNTPMSTGKTYCGGTTIRGGWETAVCETPSDRDAVPRP